MRHLSKLLWVVLLVAGVAMVWLWRQLPGKCEVTIVNDSKLGKLTIANPQQFKEFREAIMPCQNGRFMTKNGSSYHQLVITLTDVTQEQEFYNSEEGKTFLSLAVKEAEGRGEVWLQLNEDEVGSEGFKKFIHNLIGATLSALARGDVVYAENTGEAMDKFMKEHPEGAAESGVVYEKI